MEKNGPEPKNARLIRSALTADTAVANSASSENSRNTISNPKNRPVSGALKVPAIPPAAPHATTMRKLRSDMRTCWPTVEAKAEPIWTIGPSRPTEPPVPMQIAEASAFVSVTCGRIRPPFSATASITSGTPCPRASRANRWIRRPIEQTAQHRDHEKEADPQPREVGTRDPALLPELLMPGREPRDRIDQLSKDDRGQPGPATDQQRHHHQAQP